MIAQTTRVIAIILISGFLLSCAAKPLQAQQDASRLHEIQDIRITEGENNSTIEVEGEAAMLYTTFQLTDPNRLIIDIADISLGVFDQEIHLKKGPILAIRPVSGGGSNVVRLELLLNEKVEADVRGDGSNLIINASEAGRMKSKFVFFDDGTAPSAKATEESPEEAVGVAPENKEGSEAETDLSLAPSEEQPGDPETDDLSAMTMDEAPEISIEALAGVEQGTAVLSEGLTGSTTETTASSSTEKTFADPSEPSSELFIIETGELPPLVPMPDLSEGEDTEPEPSLDKAIEEILDTLVETSEDPLEVSDIPDSLVEIGEVSATQENPTEILFTEFPASEEAPAIETEAFVEAPASEEKPLLLAKRVTSIRFVKDEALRLMITADGILDPSIFRVDNKRIAIDLPGVKTTLKQSRVFADDPLVKQVRIGNHARKLRLVVDLASVVSYTWQQKRGNLEIIFRDPSVPVKRSGQTKTATEAPNFINTPSPRPSVDPEVITPLFPPLLVDTEQRLEDPQDQTIDTLIEGEEEALALMPLAVPLSSSAEEDAALESPDEEENTSEEKHKKQHRKKTFLRQRREKKTGQGTNLFVQKQKAKEAMPDAPQPKYTGKKISLDFQDAEIINVIRLLADVSHLNFVMGEDVKGKISLKLSNVPWDQALDIILEMNSLGKVQQGNIIRITTLANLANQRDEMARVKETEVNSADLLTRVIYVNYGKAAEAEALLKKLLSPRGEIMVDKRTNAIIVKDIEENLEQIEHLAKKLDTKTPQVLIEARIAEVKPSFKKSLGVQWGADLKTTQGGNILGLGNAASGSAFNAPTPDFAVNLPASDNLGGVGFTFGRFTQSPFALDLRLSAGEVQETTRIVSTPKIMVLDNHEALIEQGESIPFQTSSGNDGTKTQFIDANMTLKVTPHISPDGGILLDVLLTKNEPALTTEAGAPGPRIFKKEITTKILLMDGETVVIGGIYESKSSETESGIPWFKDLPIIGWLFKNESTSKSISELLVFITPTIMD